MSRLSPALLLLLLVQAATAQEGAPAPVPNDTPLGPVDTVFVTGNEKTRTYVITDEMTLAPGATVTTAALEYDRRRIYSLGLFTRVDISYDSLGGRHYLLVDVNERWYIFPVPVFGFRDGDPKRFFFGAGLVHNNVAGKNQKFFASAVFGYDPSLSASFLDPLLDRNSRTYWGASASFARVTNRSAAEDALTGRFYNNTYEVDGTIGKRFDLYAAGSLNAGYQIISTTDYRRGRTISPTGRDRYLFASLNFQYDTRDLAEYAFHGTYLYLSVLKSGLGESMVNHLRYAADMRQYVSITPQLAIAGRAYTALASGGVIPTYAHEYFGYHERIRGYFSTILEGEDLAGASLELRFAIVPARTFIMQELPVPMEFKVWRIGVCLSAFVDAGAIWYRNAGVGLNDVLRGQGLGVNLLLPYSFIARAEYAWNEAWRGQWIFDLRGSF
jgi:outer membrane protein assembly factor BamA